MTYRPVGWRRPVIGGSDPCGILPARGDVVAVDADAANGDVLVSQTLRVSEHARVRLRLGSGQAVETSIQGSEGPAVRAVGIDVQLIPAVASDGIIEIAVELESTAAGEVPDAPGGMRDASTVVRLRENERAPLCTMLRVRDFDGVFPDSNPTVLDRDVSVVVSATILRPPAARDASEPLFMGTEQHIRVR